LKKKETQSAQRGTKPKKRTYKVSPIGKEQGSWGGKKNCEKVPKIKQEPSGKKESFVKTGGGSQIFSDSLNTRPEGRKSGKWGQKHVKKRRVNLHYEKEGKR